MTKQPLRMRLPLRANVVIGTKQRGTTIPSGSVPDPRTASQYPNQNLSKVQRAENAIVARLDQGPLGA
jgi:hypothetical protein